MKKTQLAMSKTVYLGLSTLDLSKTVMYEFWYDYLKPKYGENEELCYMNTDSFIVHVKTDGIDKDIAKHVEKRFDISDYEIYRPLPKGKKWKSKWTNERWIRRTNHEKFVGLRAKAYTYLKENNDTNKKAKGTKNLVIKRKLEFQDHKNCLNAAKTGGKLNI